MNHLPNIRPIIPRELEEDWLSSPLFSRWWSSRPMPMLWNPCRKDPSCCWPSVAPSESNWYYILFVFLFMGGTLRSASLPSCVTPSCTLPYSVIWLITFRVESDAAKGSSKTCPGMSWSLMRLFNCLMLRSLQDGRNKMRNKSRGLYLPDVVHVGDLHETVAPLHEVLGLLRFFLLRNFF